MTTERQFLAKEMDHQEQLHKLLVAISDSSHHGSEAMRTAMATRFDLELRKGDKVLRKKMEEKRLMVQTRGKMVLQWSII